jgi:hypothetical protein
MYGYILCLTQPAANMRTAQAVKCAAVLESMLPRESDFIAFDVRPSFYVLLRGTAANMHAV